jgi:hypothetical protein
MYSLYYDIIYSVGEARKYLCTYIHCIMILFIVWERLEKFLFTHMHCITKVLLTCTLIFRGGEGVFFLVVRAHRLPLLSELTSSF